MAQCKKCGKKGIFFKVNASQLCNVCAEQWRAELSEREALHIQSKYALELALSIKDTAEYIVALEEDGNCATSTADEIIEIMKAAAEEAQKAVSAVQNQAISTATLTVETSTNTILALHERSLRLIAEAGQFHLSDTPLSQGVHSSVTNSSTRTIRTKVVGVTKENDSKKDIQTILMVLTFMEANTLDVKLVQEPDNPYDCNAIKVMCGPDHIGYIKKELAAELTEAITSGWWIAAQISEITGGVEGERYGCNIEITVSNAILENDSASS